MKQSRGKASALSTSRWQVFLGRIGTQAMQEGTLEKMPSDYSERPAPLATQAIAEIR